MCVCLSVYVSECVYVYMYVCTHSCMSVVLKLLMTVLIYLSLHTLKLTPLFPNLSIITPFLSYFIGRLSVCMSVIFQFNKTKLYKINRLILITVTADTRL